MNRSAGEITHNNEKHIERATGNAANAKTSEKMGMTSGEAATRRSANRKKNLGKIIALPGRIKRRARAYAIVGSDSGWGRDGAAKLIGCTVVVGLFVQDAADEVLREMLGHV